MSNGQEFDPITFELVRHGLNAVSNEMMVTIQRTGRSPTTTQAFDFSASFMDDQGDTLDQAVGVPMHMGTIPGAMKTVLARFGNDIAPDDVIILNDPYTGGMHLPDIYAILPIYVGSTLFAFAVTVVHHIDVGGRAAGSMAHDSTEIYQEGLRIPPLKLFEAGKLNRTLLAMIEQNVRPPEAVTGDIMGQVAACHMGARGLQALVKEYGVETFKLYCEELRNYSERMTRQAISQWPDGTYEFTDHIDEDGLDSGPIPIKATVNIHGDTLDVDFLGSSPQVRGAINCAFSQTVACTHVAVRSAMGVDIPNNQGCFRPIQVSAPEGTITNMKHPASCASRGVTGFRIVDTVLGALAQAVPQRVGAASEGGTCTGRFGFTLPDGRIKVFYDNVYGIQGALPTQDGVSGVAGLSANLSNVSVEVVESQVPLRVLNYGLVPDSGGAGKYRGGQAVQREWDILEPCNFTFRSDRRRFPPYGLAGGTTGAPSANLLNPDGEETLLPTKINMRLSEGDVFRHVSPGGGGYADPKDRDPQLVLSDWRDERVTAAHAREVYGVVIDEQHGAIDEAKTMELRRSMTSA